jgi:SAM-dependent methyltransferase
MKVERAAAVSEWRAQWSMFRDDERVLFEEWIAPVTLEDLRGKDVLECGCGGGQHTGFMAPFAASVTAVDLNTADLARERNRQYGNVRFVTDDIAGMDLGRQFDVVLCVGVIHHTDDPDRAFENIYRHCRPGGHVIVWTYSAEGNTLVRFGVEPLRKLVCRHLPRKGVAAIARAVIAALYPLVYTVYRVKWLSVLPYFEYFGNFRRLSFERNVLNVFDKLNAPQTRFTTYAKCLEWFNEERFEKESVSISRYLGVSYRLTGIKCRE